MKNTCIKFDGDKLGEVLNSAYSEAYDDFVFLVKVANPTKLPQFQRVLASDATEISYTEYVVEFTRQWKAANGK